MIVIGDLLAGRQTARQSLLLIGARAIVTLVSAWPTWIDLSGSLQAAQTIASTTNPGNLTHAAADRAGVRRLAVGELQDRPAGGDRELTHALIAITLSPAW